MLYEDHVVDWVQFTRLRGPDHTELGLYNAVCKESRGSETVVA